MSVTYVTRILQMLKTSRNASRFAGTIEYAIFAHAAGIAFDRASRADLESVEHDLRTVIQHMRRM
jgi:hypothetical protein